MEIQVFLKRNNYQLIIFKHYEFLNPYYVATWWKQWTKYQQVWSAECQIVSKNITPEIEVLYMILSDC